MIWSRRRRRENPTNFASCRVAPFATHFTASRREKSPRARSRDKCTRLKFFFALGDPFALARAIVNANDDITIDGFVSDPADIFNSPLRENSALRDKHEENKHGGEIKRGGNKRAVDR